MVASNIKSNTQRRTAMEQVNIAKKYDWTSEKQKGGIGEDGVHLRK